MILLVSPLCLILGTGLFLGLGTLLRVLLQSLARFSISEKQRFEGLRRDEPTLRMTSGQNSEHDEPTLGWGQCRRDSRVKFRKSGHTSRAHIIVWCELIHETTAYLLTVVRDTFPET